MELNFGSWWGGKTGAPRGKTGVAGENWSSRGKTGVLRGKTSWYREENSQTRPTRAFEAKVKPRPHWWKVSAHTIASTQHRFEMCLEHIGWRHRLFKMNPWWPLSPVSQMKELLLHVEMVPLILQEILFSLGLRRCTLRHRMVSSKQLWLTQVLVS